MSTEKMETERLREQREARLQRLEEIKLQTEADRLRAQAELLRLQRSAPKPETGTEREPKRSRLALTPDGPRTQRNRYSITHTVYDRLRDVDGADLFRICELVDRWFADRRGQPGRRPVDVLTLMVDGHPVVYGWPASHPRGFAGTATDEQLLASVRRSLLPEETDPETATVDPAPLPPSPLLPTTTTSRTVAPVFLPPPTVPDHPPPELQPIPLSQQMADVATVAALARVAPDQWPSPPAEMTPVPRTLWRPWLAIPPTKEMRVSQLMRSVGWSGPPLDYLLLTIIATKLSGWRWTHRQLYPKAAAACFRRAAWILRGLAPTDPLHQRIREALHIGRG